MPLGDNHSTGIAMQLSLQMRKPSTQRLVHDGFTEATLRASLLIDLALDGRIDDGTQVTIDCEPSGFTPADMLLSAIVRVPDRDVGWWIGRGPKVQRALAHEWVRAGRWRPKRGLLGLGYRYTDFVDPSGQEWQVHRDRLNQVIAGAQPASVREAVLAAVARIARLVDGQPRSPAEYVWRIPPQLLAACGSVRWLIELTDEFMIDSRARAVAFQGPPPAG